MYNYDIKYNRKDFRWVCNNTEAIRIHKSKLNEYLQKGYKRGRVLNVKHKRKTDVTCLICRIPMWWYLFSKSFT